MVDATAVARTLEQRAAFARFEYLIDQQMTVAPVTALCAYDAEIGGQAIAEVACLHPWTGPGISPFRLFTAIGDSQLALAGEIDVGCVDLFAAALEHVRMPANCSVLVIDTTDAAFVDHRALLALDEFGSNAGVAIELRQSSAVTARLASLLALGAVRTGAVR